MGDGKEATYTLKDVIDKIDEVKGLVTMNITDVAVIKNEQRTQKERIDELKKGVNTRIEKVEGEVSKLKGYATMISGATATISAFLSIAGKTIWSKMTGGE
jgi:hypothetical protein